MELLLGAYVLSALDEEERAAADAHLHDCNRHEGTLDAMNWSASRLAEAVPEIEPRPELRTRIMDAIRAEMAPRSVSLGWSRERLSIGSHACVFHSNESGLKESMAFLRVGLDEPDEFGVVFADKTRFASLTQWLQEGYAGSTASLVERGKLAMIDGAPNTEELIQKIGARLDQALADGFGLIRLLGFIGWDQPGWPDTTAIVEFEKQVNAVVRSYPAVVVCTYDIPRLGGLSLMEGGLRNHPITIMGNRIVRENPFYLAA